MGRVLFQILVLICSCLGAAEPSWGEYKRGCLDKQASVRGWCLRDKAEAIMDFVHAQRPELCVEIGTFAGSTTYPMASALAYLQRGTLYTIDAWNNKAACEGGSEAFASSSFWATVSMDEVYDQFLALLVKEGLSTVCHPIRQRSERVVGSFADHSIDMLYIDGNFSALGTLQDVLLYFPKVKKGGYIWLNDGEYRCKTKSVAFLMRNTTWVKELSGIHWLVFKVE